MQWLLQEAPAVSPPSDTASVLISVAIAIAVVLVVAVLSNVVRGTWRK